jgi:hypothetical protein
MTGVHEGAEELPHQHSTESCRDPVFNSAQTLIGPSWQTLAMHGDSRWRSGLPGRSCRPDVSSVSLCQPWRLRRVACAAFSFGIISLECLIPRAPAGGFRWVLPGASTFPPLRPVAPVARHPVVAVAERPGVSSVVCLCAGVAAAEAEAVPVPTWFNRSAAPSRIRVSSSLRVLRSNQPSALACTVPTIRPNCSANATRRCSTVSVAEVADPWVVKSDGVVVSLRLAMNSFTFHQTYQFNKRPAIERSSLRSS